VRQEFRERVRLAGDRDAVWETVGDVPTVLSWISIVGAAEEVEPDSRYRAVLEDRLGPFRLRADLDIRVTDREPGRRIAARGDGEDRQIGSRLIVDVELVLEQEPEGGTAVDVHGAYEVTGRPASLGASSIRKKAAKVIAEFFESAERALVRT
jgi:carbon monoxide dehydrogenase subunit G